jgi:hypothetical protein
VLLRHAPRRSVGGSGLEPRETRGVGLGQTALTRTRLPQSSRSRELVTIHRPVAPSLPIYCSGRSLCATGTPPTTSPPHGEAVVRGRLFNHLGDVLS